MIGNLLCRIDGLPVGFYHPVCIGGRGGRGGGHSKGMVTGFFPLSAVCLAVQAEFKEAAWGRRRRLKEESDKRAAVSHGYRIPG